MIVYVNGDSHAAAAECVTPHAFAEDDEFLWGLGRQPHPENLKASYGCEIANRMWALLDCDAESASSNARILRTTRQWLENHPDANSENCLMLIQWSTWEREEWLIDGTYYQVNASGIDVVPESHQQQYKEFVVNVDWTKKTQEAHEQIWQLHQELKDKGIKHIFFNGNNDFSRILDRKDWGVNYIGPYDPNMTFDAVLRENGYATVNPNSYHFGAEAHSFFARYVLAYAINNNLVDL